MNENTPSNQNAGSTVYMSRRERRELERSQRGVSSSSRSRSLRRFLLWGGGLCALVLIAYGMVRLSSSVQLPMTDGVLSVPVSADDHAKGASDALVTLVEYSDFQCPACAAFYPIVKRLLDEPELKDSLRVVYRNFPLPARIHAHAQLAAQASEAAALQGKFWEMHDMLFEQQQAWSVLSSSAVRERFVAFAKDIGLDVARFSDDLDSGAVKTLVLEQYAAGERSGVASTPSFFVNGSRMPHPASYEDFKAFLVNASIIPSPDATQIP